MGVSVGAGRGVPEATGVCELPDSAEAARASDVARALMAYRSSEIELSAGPAAVGVARGALFPPLTRLPGREEAGLAAGAGPLVGAFGGCRAGVTCCTCAGGPAENAGPGEGDSWVAATGGGGVTANGVGVATGVLPICELLTISRATIAEAVGFVAGAAGAPAPLANSTPAPKAMATSAPPPTMAMRFQSHSVDLVTRQARGLAALAGGRRDGTSVGTKLR